MALLGHLSCKEENTLQVSWLVKLPIMLKEGFHLLGNQVFPQTGSLCGTQKDRNWRTILALCKYCDSSARNGDLGDNSLLFQEERSSKKVCVGSVYPKMCQCQEKMTLREGKERKGRKEREPSSNVDNP